jgi:hypothetical protein
MNFHIMKFETVLLCCIYVYTAIFFFFVLFFALFVRFVYSVFSCPFASYRIACCGFFSINEKIRRLRSGANPRSWVPEASTQTPRPPNPLQ